MANFSDPAGIEPRASGGFVAEGPGIEFERRGLDWRKPQDPKTIQAGAEMHAAAMARLDRLNEVTRQHEAAIAAAKAAWMATGACDFTRPEWAALQAAKAAKAASLKEV